MKLISTIPFLFFVQSILGQDRIRSLDSLIDSFQKNKRLNGNILIAEHGKVIYKISVGLANYQSKEKLNENSIFELASVSKQFTAAAIVILHNKMKLNYDDPISKYIPELSIYNTITIRNLLNHTSGLPDYMEVMDTVFDKNKIATNKDIIAIFAKYKPSLLFEPNTKWEYSNTGYAILASIIEKSTGLSYGEFLQKEIFTPLNMNRTMVYRRRYKPINVPNYAFGYVYSDSLKGYFLPDQLEETQHVIWLDGIVGDGTVNSTIVDLLKWDRALNENKFISKKSKSEIFNSSFLNDQTPTEYGFGWFIENNGVYGKIAKHGGGWPGYRTYIERELDHDKTIIVLLNSINDSTMIPIKEIRQILFNFKPVRHIELHNEVKNKFAGDYINPSGQSVKLIFENGGLFRLRENDEKFELKPISSTKFQMMGVEPDVFYEFILKDNVVEKYIMTQPEMNVKKEIIKVN